MSALPIAFDPLLFSNKLIKAGLLKPQADIIAEVHKEVFELQDKNVEEKVNSICATREDLFRVETSFKEDLFRVETLLKEDTQRVEKSLREEIQHVEKSLREEIQCVEKSLKEDIHRLELNDGSLREEFLSLKWMSKGIIAFMVIFIVPMFIKMFFG